MSRSTFTGALIDVNTWNNGLPTNANPGWVAQTTNTWLGDPWTDMDVRMTGGQVYAASLGNWNMRGGAAGSGNPTIFVLEDLGNVDFSTTNLTVAGELTMWAQFGERQVSSILAGYGTINLLDAIINPGVSTINIRDGKLNIASIDRVKATVNFLASGTGEIVVADQASVGGNNGLNDMVLNFESGTLASFTISSNTGNVGNSAAGYWDLFVLNGGGSITGGAYVDGVLTNDLNDFVITEDGLSTTIALKTVADDAGYQISNISVIPGSSGSFNFNVSGLTFRADYDVLFSDTLQDFTAVQTFNASGNTEDVSIGIDTVANPKVFFQIAPSGQGL